MPLKDPSPSGPPNAEHARLCFLRGLLRVLGDPLLSTWTATTSSRFQQIGRRLVGEAFGLGVGARGAVTTGTHSSRTQKPRRSPF